MLKVIEVASQQGKVYTGSWTFAASPAARQTRSQAMTVDLAGGPEDFNAGLSVMENSAGYAVTVADNQLLAEYKPTVTIPCTRGWTEAIVTAPDGTNSAAVVDTVKGTLSFQVTQGGTYAIAQRPVVTSVALSSSQVVFRIAGDAQPISHTFYIALYEGERFLGCMTPTLTVEPTMAVRIPAGWASADRAVVFHLGDGYAPYAAPARSGS